MMSERIDELIALAALGELTNREADELAAAAHDPLVARQLAEALDAAARVQAAAPVDPPPALRASVLSAIADTPQDAADDPDDGSMAPVVDDAPVSLDEHRRRRRFSPVLAVAAAVLLVVAAGAVITQFGSDAGDEIAQVVDADDAVERRLEGSLSTLVVTHSPAEGAIVIAGDGVPVPNGTYQLWAIGSAGPTSVGTFRPDASGTVSARFDEVDPTGIVLGVTAEPAGGSDAPTLPILATA